MADTSDATRPKTPPGSSSLFSPEIKSTPNAVGSSAMSENIGALGAEVRDLRPFITRDIQDHTKCGIDPMLQELIYRCGDTSKPVSDKSILLKTCLDLVLPICNSENIKQHLTAFAKCTIETDSYEHFARAANKALIQLKALDVPGLPSSKADDPSDIVFHRNDPMYISQYHQGAESKRKPDIVVIPCKSARNARKGGKKAKTDEIYTKMACNSPDKSFTWPNVRSTVEFKNTKRGINPPPTEAYRVEEYKPPTQQYMDIRKEMKEMQEMQEKQDKQNPAEPPSSTRVPTAASTSKTSDEPRRQSERLKENTEKEKKRNSEHLASDDPSRKRPKSNNENNDKEEKKEPIRLPAIVQNGLYVAEMFAAHTARQHVISSVVNDDVIYVWYFDRQNAIQCSGFNFIQDLPRFLVLLLIMQRMSYAQWGMNPLFGPEPGRSPTVVIEDKEKGKVDLTFDLQSKDRTTHFGLGGRATNVFPVKSAVLSSLPRDRPNLNDTDELVAKLYWPEQSRQSEPDILKEVYEIADGKREKMTEEEREQVDGHVPEMVWFHKFEETSTANIRRALGIDDAERGSRVFYIIVFRKLLPITKLSGDEFLRAWWHVVRCHRVLWKYGVRHRDISPGNLMVYKTASGVWIGVLNDYDLSSTRDTPTGKERTGTIPFMAMDLLTDEAIQGKVEHLYRHDAESFIWVLTWVSLRYEDGELKGKSLNGWLKVDAIGCHNEKSSFLVSGRFNAKPSSSHSVNWDIARAYLRQVVFSYAEDPTSRPDNEVYQTWLSSQVPASIRE